MEIVDRIGKALKWIVEEAYKTGHDDCFCDECGIHISDEAIEKEKLELVVKALKMIEGE